MLPRHLLTTLISVVLVLAGPAASAPATAATNNPGWSSLDRLTYNSHWAAGTDRGVRWQNGSLAIERPHARRTFQGLSYDYSQWTSAWVRPGRTFTQLVPSWSALTPYGTWIQVYVRARRSDGTVTRFKDLGRWSTRDNGFRRSSAGSQSEALARVATDTLLAQPGQAFNAYQFSVQLMRLDGTNPGRAAATSGPTVRALSAVVSRLPSRYPATSAKIYGTKFVLPVPRLSQMIHEGQNPEYGGGGEAWCSPTSLAMVLGYYGRLPRPSSYAWVPDRFADPVVNHLARLTYDYRYEGTGNWPFNTAIGAAYAGDAFVTRLADLRMAERFVRARIPVIASIAFGRGELSGAPISSTAGHLVVIVGFTKNGNPIVNDPAAGSNSTVRRTYTRGQFERAWLRGSGGLSYIVRDGRALPWRPPGVDAW